MVGRLEPVGDRRPRVAARCCHRVARRGKAALRTAGPGGGAVDFEITGTLPDIVVNDDHPIASVDATATRCGKTLTYRTAWLCSPEAAAVNGQRIPLVGRS